MPGPSPIGPTTEAVLNRILHNPTVTRSIMLDVIQVGAYLKAQGEWSMEDNFNTTETLAGITDDLLSDDEAAAIVEEVI